MTSSAPISTSSHTSNSISMIVNRCTKSYRNDRFIRRCLFRLISTNASREDEAFIRDSKHNFRRKSNIGTLILLRHGQSQWNVTDPVLGTTARFTGWTDIPLTLRGIQQAVAAGNSLRQFFQVTQRDPHDFSARNVPLDAAFCSLLSRSSDTLTLCLQQLDLVLGYPPSDSILAPISATAAPQSLLPSLKTILASSSSSTPSSPGLIDTKKTTMDSSIKYKIPIISSWRLNERHYGALVGLSKEGAERLYGKTQLKQWRDGWEVAPPPMEHRQWNKWKGLLHTQAVTVVRDPGIGFGEEEEIDVTTSPLRHSNTIKQNTSTDGPHSNNAHRQLYLKTSTAHATSLQETTIVDSSQSPREFTIYEHRTSKASTSSTNMPTTESLSDTCKRILPIWNSGIAPRLREGQTIILVAHANTIRCLLYHIDPDVVSQETMKQVKIPSATPLVYTFRSSQAPQEYEMDPTNVKPSDNDTVQEFQDMHTEIPGNLLLIRRPKNTKTVVEKEGNGEVPVEDLGKHLNGIWLHSDELKSLSFCSKLGIKNLEHEIA